MSRPLILIVCALVGGFALAFAVIVAGCAQPWQLLDSMCGHNAYMSLGLFTVCAWALLGLLAVVLHLRRSRQ